MKQVRVLAGLLLALGVVYAQGEKERLDAAIDRAIDQNRVVGSVVIVARDGKIVYQRAAGFADREAKTPMKMGHSFRLASMTKPIVSMAALALADKGVINLEDPISMWLPNFRPKLQDGRTPEITIRHLLTHTAGLSYSFAEPVGGPYDQARVSDGVDQPGLSIEENLRRIASVPLSFEPGTDWSYSIATDVLGEVLSKATGKPLPQLIEEVVAKPLKMTSTGFKPKGPLATPYVNSAQGPIPMTEGHLMAYGSGRGVVFSPKRFEVSGSYPSGGAGLMCSAGDYFRFLEAMRTGGGPILKPETNLQMTSNQVNNLMANASGAAVWSFGYGVGILMDPKAAASPQSAGTYRWGGVFGTSWFVDPKEKLTVVIMTNTSMEGLNGQFPRWIRDAVYGIPLPPKICER